MLSCRAGHMQKPFTFPGLGDPGIFTGSLPLHGYGTSRGVYMDFANLSSHIKLAAFELPVYTNLFRHVYY